MFSHHRMSIGKRLPRREILGFSASHFAPFLNFKLVDCLAQAFFEMSLKQKKKSFRNIKKSERNERKI